MSTKDGAKKPLTPSERRQREMRRRRMKKKKQQRMIRIAILILIAVLAVAAIGFLAFTAVRMVKGRGVSSGESRIAAAGDTFVIALDAGHGGADSGLSNDTLEEKEVTMEIVSKLKVMFENYGYQVVLIREDDSRISKEDRAKAANDSGADLLVSVHLNYSDDASASGMETYYKKGSSQGALLAEKVLDGAVGETGAVRGGFSEGSFTILEDVEIPAVLIEVGYASNEAEAGNLADDAYCNLTAKGIAKGVIRSLNTEL